MRGAATRKLLDSLERLGLTVLPNWRIERYAMATCLQRLFELLQVDCVLDVGANIGQFRNFLRYEVGYAGRIVSFEPIPRNVDVLRARATSDAAWQVEPYALGACTGRSWFNVTATSVFSSFLQPNEVSSQLFGTESDVTERIEVEVRTLDEVLPEIERQHRFARPYLKLDTQGFDLEVVSGATQTMSRFCGLQTEASVKPIYAEMPDYAATIRRLESLGFELAGMFPVNSGTFPLMLEFDCVMVASACLARRATG
jgi:FkbM family methyltransferase